MTFKFTPAHKVVEDDHKPGQTVNPLGFTIQPSEKTLAEYIQRKTREEAFNQVKNEEYMKTINHPNFREANSLVFEAELALVDMGMPKDQARGWIKAWASGAGDGSE